MDGKMIAERRLARGMMQDELGAMLGISGKAVSKWERGLSKPCEEHAERLCQLLGLAVEVKIERSSILLTIPVAFISTKTLLAFQIVGDTIICK